MPKILLVAVLFSICFLAKAQYDVTDTIQTKRNQALTISYTGEYSWLYGNADYLWFGSDIANYNRTGFYANTLSVQWSFPIGRYFTFDPGITYLSNGFQESFLLCDFDEPWEPCVNSAYRYNNHYLSIPLGFTAYFYDSYKGGFFKLNLFVQLEFEQSRKNLNMNSNHNGLNFDLESAGGLNVQSGYNFLLNSKTALGVYASFRVQNLYYTGWVDNRLLIPGLGVQLQFINAN